ncbi:MAG: SOS response-associated peptidase [Thermoleophilia bacterium]|nr:SOS response-associated peptidase [Thermoleophilia bacterium]
MCGRYQLALPGRTLANLLDAQLAAGSVQPTWNAAPSQVLPVLGLNPSGERVLQGAEWGLVPAWARLPGKDIRPLINARAETVIDKPAFRTAVRKGRILVPVTGFYEWAGPKGSKVPHVIRVKGAAIDTDRGERLERQAVPGEPCEPFLLAGFAEEWTTPDNVPELTFTIITTTPNELCAPIHDRMPAILDGEDAQAWLETPPEQTELLLELLRPFPADRMEAWPVSRAVNDVHNDGPALAEPAPTQGTLA